jgi:hypothetical protein
MWYFKLFLVPAVVRAVAFTIAVVERWFMRALSVAAAVADKHRKMQQCTRTTTTSKQQV